MALQSDHAGTEAGFYNVSVAEKAEQKKASEEISFTTVVNELRQTFESGKTKELEWRRQQLKQVKKLIAENHEYIAKSLLKDHGGPKVRAAFDMTAAAEVDKYLKHLDEWAAPMPVEHNSMLGKSYIRKEPKGVILLITPWNFPFAMVFDALIGIIAAGNCVLIKPSEVSVNSCACLADLIPKYMDPSAVRVVTGGVPETTALLREQYDHIMYTGNGAVGRIIMSAAAKHLTPVTLELGGKSPVYVDKSAKIDLAVNRIGTVKWINAGQICVAPDYILVHEAVAEEFKKQMVQQVKKFYGSTPEERMKNKDFARIINDRHVKRIDNLVSSTHGKILIGGKSVPDEHYFEPTIIDSPDLEDEILKEEIFGPIMPILKVANVEEAAKRVNKICNKPLSLYVFAQDQNAIDFFLNNTNSGGVCVNGALEQLSNHNLPFGGVGESGIGRYHGKWGFDEFTHFRSVLIKDSTFTKASFLPPPPYKDSLYDLIIKFTVTGFLTETQRSLLKAGGLTIAALAGYQLFKSRL